MTIHWQESVWDEDGMMTGHGLGIYRVTPGRERGRLLVAFVEGFSWLRNSAEVVVLFAPERWPIDAAEHAALRRSVEDFLCARQLLGEVAPGYEAFANA